MEQERAKRKEKRKKHLPTIEASLKRIAKADKEARCSTPAKNARRRKEWEEREHQNTVDSPRTGAREPGEGKRTPDHWKELFLKTLAATCDVAAAARAANISHAWAYEQKHADPIFATAWKKALDESTDTLVGEVYRRAAQGVRRLKFQTSGPMAGLPYLDPNTGLPYVEHEYSDTLALKLLSAHRPEVYRESSKIDMTVETKPPLTIQERAERLAALRLRREQKA